ncbi:MAG: DUF4129 domain-containing protein [Actinomycetes bacterium]
MWRRGALALAALLLLVLAVLGARTTPTGTVAAVPPAPVVVTTEAQPTPGAQPRPLPEQPLEADPVQPDRTVQRVVAALALLGLAALVGYALWRFTRTFVSRRPARRAGPSGSTEAAVPAPDIDVAAAVAAAEQQLTERADGLPADAIIAAWLALEDAAAGAGMARQRHQTPTEFTMDVLTIELVDAAALDELRRCYQRARFGTEPATDDDIATAVAALRHLRQSLPQGTPA